MQGRGPGYPMKHAIELHPASEPIPASETAFIDREERSSPDPITVLAGFRLLSGDIGAFSGVQLVYSADGKIVRQVYDYAAFLCHKREHCQPPEGIGHFDWTENTLRGFGLVH